MLLSNVCIALSHICIGQFAFPMRAREPNGAFLGIHTCTNNIDVFLTEELYELLRVAPASDSHATRFDVAVHSMLLRSGMDYNEV